MDSDSSSSLVLEFPITSSSEAKIPRRIRRRLSESRKSPSPSIEEIEAKLKEATLRRQQFHEWLSNKARRKPTSPSSSSSSSSQHQHRLEAKLHAAQQKRLDTIAKAQTRLAKLDQLRQDAKSQVERRFQIRKQELGTKVESRVHKARLNRMLLLNAHSQRKAAANQRIAQSILKRMAQDRIYKDFITARIYQKRAAAETKRLRLLEAQKTRVQAQVTQVRTIATTVYHQREIQRRTIKNRLDDRLQKAKRQRAEFLKQRGSPNTIRVKLHRQGEILSRKLARCWRQFLRSRKTTFSLAKDYEDLEINEKTVKVLHFEQFAKQIESARTLQIVKSVLDRLESRLTLSRGAIGSSCQFDLNNIDHLLKRLVSPKRSTRRDTARSRGSIKGGSSKVVKDPFKLSRYPVRVVLCAYMVVGHPAAVFNGEGEHEVLLTEAAANLIREFELLIKIIIDGPTENIHLDSASLWPTRMTFRSQLEIFDAAWCSYLYRFVNWKLKDARSLEEDLVRAACQMELSMMQTCRLSAEEENHLSHDMKAVQNQVMEDQKLLREKVLHLTGDAGVQRMECALSDTRSGYFEVKNNGNPVGLPFAHISSPSVPSSSVTLVSVPTSTETSSSVQGGENPRRVVRSLFKNDSSYPPEGFITLGPNSSEFLESSSGENLLADNEFLVNEIIHEHSGSLTDSLELSNGGQDVIKAKIKKTMEEAFWDGITESLKLDEPDYGRVVELVKEVRDELCEMAPRKWKQNIFVAIDLDILSQVLVSGTHDLGYLRKVLEFALDTLQKLSAPATEDEMVKTRKKLMTELGEISQDGEEANTLFVIAMVKGLRLALEQTQALKRETSKARIRILEPVIKGPAGFEYLRKAFGTHYGSPPSAPNSLPATVQWLLSVQGTLEQAWDEHTDSISGLSLSCANCAHGVPQTSLRTGGSMSAASQRGPLVSGSPVPIITTDNHQPECIGNGVDKLVRFGLLKLICGTSGITEETVPETLRLNLSRLRIAQAQLQIIIVMCISILVLRQTLVSEKLETSAVGIEEIVCNSVEKIAAVKDVGIIDIVDAVCESLTDDGGKLQSMKQFMANLLAKSLRAGDPVFERVSAAIHVAARGVVFGGSGPQGKELVVTALRRVGAVVLSEKLIKAVEVLIVVATASQNVHGPWYLEIIKNL